MKRIVVLLFFLTPLLLLNCTENTQQEVFPHRALLLKASREAPLGWLYLELYSDSTFKATSAGLRDAEHYRGNFSIHVDTLLLHYPNTIPQGFATKMYIMENTLNYIDTPGILNIDTTQIDPEKLTAPRVVKAQ